MFSPSEKKAGLLLKVKGQQKKKGPSLDQFPVVIVIVLLTLWVKGQNWFCAFHHSSDPRFIQNFDFCGAKYNIN